MTITEADLAAGYAEFFPDEPHRAPKPRERRSTGASRPALLIAATDVTARPPRFVWDPYIPTETTTLLAGLGGLGKSSLSVELAARLTRGDLDGDYLGTPASVVMVSAEDSYAFTMRPRLEAAGADLSRVHFIDLDETDWSLDASQLDALAGQMPADVALVVIDPLNAFLPLALDSHKDQHVRAAMRPLRKFSEASGAATLVVCHLNKSESSTLAGKVGGSAGVLNASRSGLLVAEDPQDPARRVLAHGKVNITEPGVSRAFHIEGAVVNGPDGPIKTSRVVFLGEAAYTIEELLGSRDGRRAPRDAVLEWLHGQLAHGPVAVKDLQQQALEEGHSWRTVERAKKEINVKAAKDVSPDGVWVWSLPVENASPPATGRSGGLR